MEDGLVGRGMMGGNMRERLRRGGHTVLGYARNPQARDVASLEELVEKLSSPRVVWLMIPAGDPTRETVRALAELLQPGDVVVEGGNSRWTDDIEHAALLGEKGIGYLDCGVSGGVWGLTNGYALMVGGSAEDVAKVQPIFDHLKPAEQGFVHAGPVGAGHFAKMVHNGIEYGLMQAYAEGFDILRNKSSKELPEDERFTLDAADIAEVWRRGSVVSSWLLDLSAEALAGDADLSDFSGEVQDSGEGRWTIQAAIEETVPVPVLSASLYARFRSRSSNTFGERLLSAMRFEFGGHVEAPRPPERKVAEPKLGR